MSIDERAVDSRTAATGVRCGDCLHFKKGPKAPVFSDLCSNEGVGPPRKPCKHFTPNHYKLVRHEPDTLKLLAVLDKRLGPSASRLLGYMFIRSQALRSVDVYMGQRVYFSLGGNYLIHYFSGRVVGIANDRKHLLLSSRFKDAQKTTAIMMPLDSILTEKQWGVKQKQLVKDGRIFLPKESYLYKQYGLPLAEYIKNDGSLKEDAFGPKRELDYVPPTLDSAPIGWLYPTHRSRDDNMRDVAKRRKGKLAEKSEKRIKDQKQSKRKKKTASTALGGIVPVIIGGKSKQRAEKKRKVVTALHAKKVVRKIGKLKKRIKTGGRNAVLKHGKVRKAV